MNLISKTLGFLSALLIAFPVIGNVPLADVQFVSTELVLPSIDGRQYTAERFSGTDLGNGSFSWVGKIRGARSGFVSLAVVNGESTWTVSFADGITYSGRGELENLTLTQYTSGHKVCGGCVASGDLPTDPRRMRAQPMLSWQNGDANLIDLLVVYPAVVRTDAGGTSAIQAEIIKAVADTNLCYQNSRVNVQLRLVHMEEVSYAPTGLLDTDLTRLKGMNDGYMDNVHTLRDNNGADLVALLTTESDSGGLASTLSHPSLNFESSGFSVNVWNQISAPSYTLAHEIGHNMGCLHNIEDSTGVTPLYDFGAFCYGKRWFSSGQGVKTVMSYDTNPSSTYPTTIPYFSNPQVIYEGTQTGNPGSADNALVLSSTAPYVSNFRASVIQGILPEAFHLEMEEGNYSNLSIRMSAKPTVPIQVVLSVSGDPDFMLTSGNILNFDSSNWNLPHPVQIYAKPDSDTISDTATLIFSSNGLPSVSVALNEVDNSSNPVLGFLFSGVVVNELGVGLEGVSITLSNGGGETWTDQDGAFLLEISSNWSGAVTFLREGYSFSPSGLNLGPVSSDSIGHSIEATRSDILFVNVSATGAGDGTSWGNAYTDLGDALRSTTPFNEVWVASGTYKAGLVRSSFFLIPPGIEVYGGFSGNEISRNSRNIEANRVVLSGDLGILNNNSDNAFHVVVPSNGSVLDGFTITGGNASENFNDDDRGKGGGLWADSSNFTVSHCTFVSNHSYQGGSALYLKDVNSTFLNCEFTSNTTGSTGSGGAVYLEDSNVTFSGSSFYNNHSDYHAGAIKSENSDINLIFCTFSSNRSLTSNGAGAIYLLGGNYLIRSTLFESNQATFQGGAILISNSSGVIEDSNFTGNQNTQLNGGGALYIENCSPLISRCNFSENITTANNNGGAIKLINSSPQIIDSSFIRNQSQVNSAGAIALDSTSIPILSNNIFQFNSAAQFGGAIFVNGSDLSINGGLLQGNSANYGGAIATQGSVGISIQNIRALGNEANASASANAGFVYLNSGVTSSIFVNCEISGNKSNSRYGVYRPSGATKFVNCTLVGNVAGTEGGITLMFGGDAIELNNCIVWNNSAGTGNDIWVNDGTATANYSLFVSSDSIGTISGPGNLSGNPLFVDADGVDNLAGTLDDDLRLQLGSPAIDQASSALANYPIVDLNGSLRAGEPDMGAYEYWPVPHSFVYNGAHYEIIKQSATWPQAANIAMSKGGKLVEINDAQEQNAIFSEIANASITLANTTAPDGGGGAYLWIGGNDIASESTWIWNGDNDQGYSQFWIGDWTGSAFSGSYHNWGNLQLVQNEPDDYQGQQDALAISIDGWPLGTAGQWNDINENNNLFFVVEFNAVPVVTSAPSFSVSENQTHAGMVVANDPNGDELLFSISGGNDQSHFTINSVTGLLTFISTPDFENPTDFDGNNSYEITIGVSDGKAQINQNILIYVLDVDESEPSGPQLPAFEFNATLLQVPENAPHGSIVGYVYRVSGDLNQTVFFSLEQNGSLSDPFTVESNGTIWVDGSLDYETNASHAIHIRGMEGNRTDVGHFVIYVLDVNESWGEPIDVNESGYGVGPEFSLDTRDPTTDPPGGGEPIDVNESGYGVGPEFSLDTRDPTTEPPGGGGEPIDLNESGYGVGPEFSLDTRDPTTDPPGGGEPVDGNESGYGVGPEFSLDTRDPTTEPPGGGGEPIDLNESGYGVGPEFSLDTRDPTTEPPGGGGEPIDVNESGYGVGPEFSLDTRDPTTEPPGGGGEPIDVNESGYGVGPEFSLDTRDPTTEPPGGGGEPIDVNESGYGVGPEFSLDTRDPTTEPPGGGGGEPIDVNESGYGVGPEFSLDTRDPTTEPPGGGEPIDVNESGYGVGPEFSLDTRDPTTEPPGGGGGEPIDVNESGYGVGPEFSLDTRDPTTDPPGGGEPVDGNESGYGVGPEFSLDTRDPTTEPPGGGEPIDVNESGYGVGPEFSLDTRDPTTEPPGGGEPIDVNESGYGVGPEFSLDTRDPTTEPPGGGGGEPIDVNESGYGVGPEFSLDTRDPTTEPPGGGEPIDVNESGYGVGPGFSLDTRDPTTEPPGGGEPIDVNGSGYGVGPEFSLDTRDEFDGSVLFDFNASVLAVSEDALMGTEVGYIYQSHGDFNDSVSFDLIHDPASPPLPFRLESNGSLITVGALDYEENPSYPLEIRGWTSEGESAFHVFTVSVLDVYEEAFDFNASVLAVSEDALIGTEVGSIYQSHGDFNDSVSFDLVHDPASPPLPFRLESNGSLITVGALDYEENASYPLEIRGWTSEGESAFHVFTVSVLDVYEEAFDFNATVLVVSEDALIGTEVGSISQSHGDFNDSVSFDLVHDPASPPLPFRLESNGSLITVGALDYEENASYPLEIRGWTSEGESAFHVFTVSVLDVYEELFDFNASVLAVSEDALIGTEVGSISQSHGDFNDSVSFDLVHDPASPPLPFRLESNGSLITVGALDYEENANYPLEIRGWTSEGESAFHVFTVSVLDVYEELFDFNASVLVVSEDALIGTEVGSISQSHGDFSDSVSFDLVHDPASPPLPFRLESNGSLITVGALDYEENASYPLEIRGWTSEGESAFHVFTVSVLDVYEEAFDFNASVLVVSEDALIGTEVGSISQSHGDFNDSVSFDLVHDPASPPLPFRLESNGSLITVGALDYEENASYPLEIRGWTSEGESAFHVFTVSVLDVYEEAFDFNASVLVVSEDALIGTEVGFISQSRGDFNSSVSFDLVHDPASPPLPFRLESNGSLITVGALDYEENASYPLEIRGWTSEGESAFHVFTVSVLDVYEEAFDFNASVLAVSEDALIGTEVGYIYQSHGDGNLSVSYQLINDLNSSSLPFRLESNGSLVTIDVLNFLQNPFYPIKILGVAGNSRGIKDFTISVLHEYQNAAGLFDFNSTKLEILENTPVGALVGQMHQVNGNVDLNMSYRIELDSNFSDVPFLMDSSGLLLSSEILDYETNSSYSIQVIASSDNIDRQTRVFEIVVLDIDETPFDFNASVLAVSEDALIGTEVGSISQSHGDFSDSVSFDLVHDPASPPLPFRLESNGSLITVGALDYEENVSYPLEIRGWTSEGESAFHVFTVSVLDVYEEAFDFNASVLAVSEDALIGTEVGSISQSHGDFNDSVSFDLVHDPASPPLPFRLESNGSLITVGALDYEENASYPLEIRGWTSEGESAFHVFTVSVLDVYEEAFDFNASVLAVSEDALIGTEVGSISQSHGDFSDSVSFDLVHDPASPPLPFRLESNGSLITVGALDYEENASYPLEIRGWTSEGESAFHVFTVSVLDVYEELFDFNASVLAVSEDALIGTEVGSISQSHGDFNDSVSFDLVHDPASPPLPFRLESNGSLITVGALDYEENASYPLEIRGWTSEGESVLHVFTVSVLDVYEELFDFNASVLVVSEDALIGTEVGSISQSHGDFNDSVSFDLVHDPASPPLPFRLESNGSLITVGALDYEENASYPLEIRGWTSEGESAFHVFTVSVLDVYEELFDFNASVLVVSEDALIGTEVGSISQSHGDFNDSVSFDLVHDPASPPLPFRLESNGSLITVGALDYEENASYPLEIRGWTSEGESAFHVFTVSVLDVYEEAFDFNASVLVVSEDALIGTEVGFISQSRGDFNSSVSFDLVHDPASPPLPFRLESNGSLITVGALDYEENASYPLEIRGWTSEGESAFHVFTVSVLDVYESDPFSNNLPYGLDSVNGLSVNENEPIGTVVGLFTADDPDVNATLSYSLHDQNESTFNTWFSLDINGTLRTSASFDYETHSSYMIRVRAYDEYQAFIESTFTVQVIDLIESVPFDFNSTSLQVAENAPIGTPIGNMFQTAGDENLSVAYSLIYDPLLDPIPFQMDTNGSLYTSERLDYETHSSYVIEVNAISDGIYVTRQFVIELINQNDVPNFVVNGQHIENSEFAFAFAESTPPVESGTPSRWLTSADILNKSGRITIDLNGGVAGEHYLIKLGDQLIFDSGPNWRTAGTAQKFDYDRFVIDFFSGLSTSFRFVPQSNGNSNSILLGDELPLDSTFDNKSYYLEAFGLSDDGSPTGMVGFLDKNFNNLGQVTTYNTATNSSLLSIIVESSTLFQMKGKYQSAVPLVNVSENQDFVIDLNATDPNGDSLTYSIQSGADGSKFTLDSFTGVLRFKSPPDYEKDFSTQGNSHYEVLVRVSDGESSTSILVPVFVNDLDETLPNMFEFNATSLLIEENTPVGTLIGSVYRLNGDFNQSVIFELEQDGSGISPFSVQANGTILVAGSLDYEQNSSHLIRIRGTEGNQSLVRGFEIQILDVFEMDINSAPTDISILSDKLQIKGNQDAGTMVGDFYAKDSDQNDMHTFILVDGVGSFDNSLFVMETNGTLRSSLVLDFGIDQNLSIRVQVSDSKGATYQKVFDVLYIHQQAGEDVILLSDGADVVPGWKRTGWFGFYFADFYPWVYHENLGWIFVSEKTDDGAWFFRERLGWVWTSPEVFPALFQFEQNQWTYLDTSTPWTILFDYDRMEWFELDHDFEVFGLSQPASGGYVKGFGIYQRGQVATLEAVPSSGYIFKGWEGDITETEPVLILEVYNDFKMEALFDPIISPDKSPEEAVGNAVEAINSIEGLSPELKQKALAELLLTGASSTAGIKATGK